MKSLIPKRKIDFLSPIATFFSGSFENRAFSIDSEALSRSVNLDTFYLRAPFSFQPCALLLVNDGQDFEALQMEKTLRQLQEQKQINNLLLVGIHAGDRMQEYGTAHQSDYAHRGSKAGAYTQFIIDELLPSLQEAFPLHSKPEQRAFAGFSLGALSALDIVWNHADTFHKVGVFSGSLWWRSAPFDPARPDDDLIMQAQIANGTHQQGLQFWFQAGTHDEDSDRNNNGVIDAIDDTMSTIAALEKLAYQNGRDITYREVDQGQHNPGTWGAVMPEFLIWCFGKP